MGTAGESVTVGAGAAGTDRNLINAVRAGDPAAMAGLYERHRGHGLNFARALMTHPEDAEDVLAEAFTKAVTAIRNGFGPTENFGAYLSTCVKSVANTVWKKSSRERPSPLEEFGLEAVEDPALEDALSVFEHGHVTAAMQTLPERWRTVLWHAEVAGLPPREIAPLMGIEPNAVSSLLIRARAGLREAYELQTQQPTQPQPALEEAGKR